MTGELSPYLSFKDNTREVMTFYQQVFGGELAMNTFGEFGMSDDPSEQDKVMHSQLTTDRGQVIMAADTPNSMEFTAPAGFSLALFGQSGDEAELRGYYDQLADGGTPAMPLEKAPWGDTFGMVIDRFGVSWMVNISGT